MRIKTYVERGYNIDYKAVVEDLIKLKRQCDEIEDEAILLNKAVPQSHNDIVSSYYEKTHEITKSILKKINNLEAELLEVIASAEDFADRIESTTKVKFPM